MSSRLCSNAHASYIMGTVSTVKIAPIWNCGCGLNSRNFRIAVYGETQRQLTPAQMFSLIGPVLGVSMTVHIRLATATTIRSSTCN